MLRPHRGHASGLDGVHLLVRTRRQKLNVSAYRVHDVNDGLASLSNTLLRMSWGAYRVAATAHKLRQKLVAVGRYHNVGMGIDDHGFL